MKRIFLFISLGLLAASCVKTEVLQSSSEMGALCMDMSLGTQTRAESSAEDEILKNAVVNIYKADFSGLVRSYKYSEIPETIYLAADQYRVDVKAGECVKSSPAVASWDSKSYKGSENFEIKAKQNSDVTVTAKVNNAVTAISFDETIAANFSEGYTLTIGLDPDDANTNLIYDASKSGKSGYFIIEGVDAPSFTWTFKGKLSKDGSDFEKTGAIEEIEQGKKYSMTLKYTIKDGDVSFTLSVDYDTDIKDDVIVFEPVATGLAASSKYEIWAAHATVHADVDPVENAGKKVQFAYSATPGVDSSWKEIDGVDNGDGTWESLLTGLTSSTQYTYRLLIDGEKTGDDMTFTTEDAPKIPNGSFEDYSKVSGKDFYKFYNPASENEDGKFKFWASGNGDEETSGGLGMPAAMADPITVIDFDQKKDGNVSVRAQSIEALGVKLAAGNLFTGQFLRTEGTNGGIVNFGYPWPYRPTALKLWCKYSSGKIDEYSGQGLAKDDYDRAQIKVAMGYWTAAKYGGTKNNPIQINTTDTKTFVDFYTDDHTIANGDIVIYNDGYVINNKEEEKVNTKVDEWMEITIPLDYRVLNKYPTHIVVSCASSMFGDYFVGSTTSKLWIDAVELIYE